MTFEEILDQGLDPLRRRRRVTYGALKHQFALDDAYADVFWVTEVVGREHIEARLAVFSHDRNGAFQPIVEVTV